MALLIPLIIVAGLLAVLGAVTVRACRRRRTRLQRAHQSAVPAVVHLDATAAEATLGGAA